MVQNEVESFLLADVLTCDFVDVQHCGLLTGVYRFDKGSTRTKCLLPNLCWIVNVHSDEILRFLLVFIFSMLLDKDFCDGDPLERLIRDCTLGFGQLEHILGILLYRYIVRMAHVCAFPKVVEALSIL